MKTGVRVCALPLPFFTAFSDNNHLLEWEWCEEAAFSVPGFAGCAFGCAAAANAGAMRTYWLIYETHVVRAVKIRLRCMPHKKAGRICTFCFTRRNRKGSVAVRFQNLRIPSETPDTVTDSVGRFRDGR